MMIRNVLVGAAVVATASVAGGCAAVDSAQNSLGAGPSSQRSGHMCFVRDATFSGAVNGRAYLGALRDELPAIVADDGPAEVCVVDVTGNPTVSSNVQRFSLVSRADDGSTRRREVNRQLAALQSALVSPYQHPPACLQRVASTRPASTGSHKQRALDGPSHASAVFETFLLAARVGGLKPGDRIVGLTDGIERRGAVNLTTTPLLDATRPQPGGRK